MSDPVLQFEVIVDETLDSIKKQMESRGVRASKELMNAKTLTLRGKGSGRRYRVPNTGTYYTASAPGEVPASRTGTYRDKWEKKSFMDGDEVHSQIESKVMTDGKKKYVLGNLLEDGSPGGQLKPRPHQQKIIDKAEPSIRKIYNEPYT